MWGYKPGVSTRGCHASARMWNDGAGFADHIEVAEGTTVAQLYAAPRFTVPGIELPKDQLAGFQKTADLKPGQTPATPAAGDAKKQAE